MNTFKAAPAANERGKKREVGRGEGGEELLLEGKAALGSATQDLLGVLFSKFT